MSGPLVTVITATTGNPLLKDCIESVMNQTHDSVQHLIYVDGPAKLERFENSLSTIENFADRAKALEGKYRFDVVKLPYSTGNTGWLGHRIYGSGTYVAEGEYIMFLDDDNYIDPDHIKNGLEVIKSGKDWAYCLRKIVDEKRSYLCNDDCESLGKWPSILNENDFFIDVNCYFLPRNLALMISPLWHWYGQFRVPGKMEADRAISMTLRQNAQNFDCTYKYTVNYTAGNTQQSVQPEFFKQGNSAMLKRYNGVLPWKK